METTKNLGLAVHGVSEEDLALTFLQWRTRLDGIAESNMVKMDDAFGKLKDAVDNALDDARAATDSANTAAGSATTSASNADAATARANAATEAANQAKAGADASSAKADASADNANAAAKEARDAASYAELTADAAAARADDAKTKATTAATDANTAADRANKAADRADNSASACDETIARAEIAIKDANTATGNANAAAANANSSADLADEASQTALESASVADAAAAVASKWGNVTVTVAMLPSGEPAVVVLEDEDTGKVLSFSIPRGLTGLTPHITIGNVETGAPGTDVIASMRGTAEEPILDLVIPRGDTGSIDNMPYATREPSNLASEPSVGVSERVAREDHVHSLPSIEEIGVFSIGEDEIDDLSFA